MNNLLKLSAASLLFSASALYGQIEINENLSVTGFIDMSIVNTDNDPDSSSDTSYNLDQAEVDFIFSFEEVTGQVDLNYLGDNDDGEFDLEQAFITYDFGEGNSLTAGKFLSYLGWETAEPTGLYQYSYAYDMNGTIPGYFNGVTYTYGSDAVSYGVSLVDSIYGPDGSLSDSEYGVEVMAKFVPVDGVTLFLGYAHDSMDIGDDLSVLNFWASYELNGATYAVEFNDYDFGVSEGNQWLVMGSWPFSDSGAITARISSDEDDSINESHTKYTISPSWAINDNLLSLLELSVTDYGAEGDVTAIAFETIFTF